MGNGKGRRREREAYWRGRIKEQAGSGLSVSGFCRREGISPNSFYGWRRKITKRDGELRQEEKGAGSCDSIRGELFVPVSIVGCGDGPGQVQAKRPEGSLIEVVLSCGRLVRVGPGFDSETLRLLISVLDENPC